jgi:hypothetical protein
MKNKIFLMATAALALAACSNDEIINTQQASSTDGITFRTIMNNSRAVETKTDNLTKFWVTATNSTGYEFKDQEFDKGDDGIFTVPSEENTTDETGKKKFTWPTSTLRFFAISPDCSLTFDNVTEQPPKLQGYTPAPKIREQVDIVYATNKGSRSDFEKQVPLKFNHAMSEIIVFAKNENKSYNVYVKGYRIGYVSRKGTFTFPEAETNTSLTNLAAYNQAVGTWNNLDYTAGNGAKGNNYSSEFISEGNKILLQKDATRIYVEQDASISGDTGEGSAMIIPQNGTKWNPEDPNKALGRYLAVLVQINYRNDDGSDGAPVYPYITKEDADGNGGGIRVSYAGLPFYYGYAAVPISENWEPGKRYTYYLDFTNGCGYVDPELPTAYDPTDGSVDDDGNPINEPDENLDKDGDGVPDDEDGDGIPDGLENGGGTDSDGDGIPDDKDLDEKDPYSPNDPIIGHEIAFKVEVTDWVEAIQTGTEITPTDMGTGKQSETTTDTTTTSGAPQKK